MREHFGDFGLTERAGPRNINGTENQVALTEVFAGIEVHVGEEPMVTKLVETRFCVDQSGIGNEFQAVMTPPVARRSQHQGLRENGRKVQTVGGHLKADPSFSPVEADGLVCGGPIGDAESADGA
jgi:hypothetical protein